MPTPPLRAVSLLALSIVLTACSDTPPPAAIAEGVRKAELRTDSAAKSRSSSPLATERQSIPPLVPAERRAAPVKPTAPAGAGAAPAARPGPPPVSSDDIDVLSATELPNGWFFVKAKRRSNAGTSQRTEPVQLLMRQEGDIWVSDVVVEREGEQPNSPTPGAPGATPSAGQKPAFQLRFSTSTK